MNIEDMKSIPGMRVRWCLSNSHGESDICDKYASGGPNGDGIYDPSDCPPFPAHDGCRCYLSLEPMEAGAMIDSIREWKRNPSSRPEIESWYQNNKDKF